MTKRDDVHPGRSAPRATAEVWRQIERNAVLSKPWWPPPGVALCALISATRKTITFGPG